MEKGRFGEVELQKLSSPEIHVLKSQINAIHLEKWITYVWLPLMGFKKNKWWGNDWWWKPGDLYNVMIYLPWEEAGNNFITSKILWLRKYGLVSNMFGKCCRLYLSNTYENMKRKISLWEIHRTMGWWWWWYYPPGDIWRCLNTFLVVITKKIRYWHPVGGGYGWW